MKRGITLLTLCLAALCVAGCVSFAPGSSDEERIASMLDDWRRAFEKRDVDGIMKHYSEAYQSEQVGGKEKLREFIQGAMDRGMLDNMEMGVKDAAISVDGNLATVGPVAVISARGTMPLRLQLQKEYGGKWRIVGSGRF